MFASIWNWTCMASWRGRTNFNGPASPPSYSSRFPNRPDRPLRRKPPSAIGSPSTWTIPAALCAASSKARANARSVRGTINSGMWRELNMLYIQLNDADFQPPGRRFAARILPSRRMRQLSVSGRLRCHAQSRRRLAVHPTRQVSRARRKDIAHPRHPVPLVARPRQSGRSPAGQSPLGRRAAELPGL